MKEKSNKRTKKFTLSNRFFLIADILLIIGSYLIAFFLRFYPDIEANLKFIRVQNIIVEIFCYLLIFLILNIYSIMWAYSNIKDIYKLAFANFISAFLYWVWLAFFSKGVSRLAVLINFFFVLSGSIFYRALYRDYYSRRSGNFKKTYEKEKSRILIIGAGEAGRNLLAEIIRRGQEDTVVGFLDDDVTKRGKYLNGKRIFGDIEKLSAIVSDYAVNKIYIAIPSATSIQINTIVSKIKNQFPDIQIKIIPSVFEISENASLLKTLRDVSIEDLLGRKEYEIDLKAIQDLFTGKKILVTGAGGSIGSEICRQLLKFDIEMLIAVGRGEFSIYNLIKELEKYCEANEIDKKIVYRIANIKNISLMDNIFENYKPDIIFHAAAHKHVPMMEFNEAEAIANNIFGTKNILELSVKHNVKKCVVISTDKAVNPVNIMGATKRASELLAIYYYKKYGLCTTIVRFGNVLGSRGSVLPLFKEQIEKGGPITVTHPDIQRYFMTIPEAAILTINASSYSEGGDIFVLDMGQQYKIVEIARNLINFYGLTEGKDISIVYTGLRPGEKLYEELYFNKEELLPTNNKSIMRFDPMKMKYERENIEKFIQHKPEDFINMSKIQIREEIKSIVPEYNFDSEFKDNIENSKLIS